MNSPEPEAAAPTHPPEDPFAALDDLMCVIEALCPVWPQRPLSTDMNFMIL
jgi:hypothetical protein